MKKIAILFGLSFLFVACNSSQKPEALQVEGSEYDFALAENLFLFDALPSSAKNEENLRTEEKIALGHALYFDTRLSLTGNNSCNSCHNLASFGVDNLPTSPGDNGGFGDRNSPTVLNAALHSMQFWDGRMKDVEEQAGGPILNPVEMAIPSQEFLMNRLKDIELYQKMFAAAYPNEEDLFTYKNVQYAIASFERELLTPSRFDEYLKGNKAALSKQEKQGMMSFVLNGCATCHNGALLGGNSFQKFGVYDEYWKHTGSKKIDLGLSGVSTKDGDKHMFKTPSLRNVAETAPYFHDGSVADLEEAIAIMGKIQLNKELSEAEVSNIAAFLKALTGSVPSKYQVAPEVLN
ncbi:MAG: c-type cytochrome [Chitinophagales bacterium]|nr:c-type cytochrome [Chitinophagales bacterium]